MEKVVSTLTLQYRGQWGTWEAIREIVQNSLDELECLPTLSVVNDTVIIQDEGAGMTKRQFLLLGISEKSGDNKRGQYGEGLKIGLVILLREGYKVTVKSQDWSAVVTTDMLEGEPVVAYEFNKLETDVIGVQYHIKGISIKEIKGYFEEKFLPKESEHYIVNNERYGRMMTGPYAGKLYQRGIYVCEAPKKTNYGYDLYKMKLGTDRSFANSWSMGWEIANVLALLKDEEVISDVRCNAKGLIRKSSQEHAT